jgi:hypothetical protein
LLITIDVVVLVVVLLGLVPLEVPITLLLYPRGKVTKKVTESVTT